VIGGARISAHQAISSYGLGGKFGRSWLDRLIARIRRLPRPLMLSLRNTFRRKARVALTLLSLTIGGVMFIMVLSVGSSFRNTVDTLLNDFGLDVLVVFDRMYRVDRLVEIGESVPGVAEGSENMVVAEAVIEPARWSELHFDAAGTVVEVLVAEGDAVAAGDVLARLGTADLERAVARAELDLRQAQLRLERLQEPPDEADVRQAEHAVAQAAAALQAARLNLTAVLDDPIRHETLEDAQNLYDDLRHKYEARLEMYQSGEELDYWFVDQAKQRLDDAELTLNRIRQQGAVQLQSTQNEVAQAAQAHQEAQDRLARLLRAPDAKEIEAAELDVRAAELALAQARDALDDAVLRAPVAGVVTQVHVEVGETAAPGAAALVVATLERLQARTVDLTELDVARVTVGQPAVVTVDALPGVELAGVVREIALQAGDYRGDVVYAVTVELTDVGAAPLRWGMTAVVEIAAR